MIGKSSIDVIKDIVANASLINFIQLGIFDGYKLFKDRIEISEEIEKTINSAFDLKKRYNISFGDGFNMSLFDKKIKNFDFFEEILFHNHSKKLYNLTREEVCNFNGYNLTDYTAFTSQIIYDNQNMHLPLLDFHLPINLENQEISKNVIKYLGLKGYLFDSGKSYHFIGTTPLSEYNYRIILYRALLFAPIIDRAWISHQLIQGFSCLRISKKYDRLPLLVSIIK